jgi:SOS response regulatory protein OraA/RecX
LSNEGQGRIRVMQDLRQRRVAPSLAEKTVRQVYEGVDDEALIEGWIRKKYRQASREGLFQEEKDLAAAYRRLLRAGFRTGEIVRVLKRFAKNPDLLDNFEPPAEEMEE